MDVRPTAIEFAGIQDYVEQSFRLQAEQKGLDFTVEMAPGLPDTLVTDEQRLRQVLKNLLSNAIKFTDSGRVTLSIGPAPAHTLFTVPTLAQAERVVAFGVSDTGIGVPPDKLMSIFEAFQQADGTTSRKYGGTGLGLSISREIA
ncbi:MAG: ATP-binding protein, partial [Mycobacterium leprae]